MKIGILTFHCAHNYGAVLQAHALQQYLKNVGYESDIINYRPKYLVSPYSLNILEYFKSNQGLGYLIKFFISELLLFRRRFIRYYKFNNFINNKLRLSHCRIDNSLNIPNDYDIYIFGSDQIWNSNITKGPDDIFWGNFEIKNNAKRIAYAASMEEDNQSQEEKLYFQKALKRFNSISVREKEVCKFLQTLTNVNIKIVLDPTFLLNSEDWNKLISKNKVKKKYILVYQVRKYPETIKIANELANQIGGVVIELVASLDRKYIKYRDQTASPEDFVSYIKHAECIVTTSFHGTAFSIILNRPFYTVIMKDGHNNRSRNLLERLSLSERLIALNSNVNYSEINFVPVNKILADLKAESYDFLIESIER